MNKLRLLFKDLPVYSLAAQQNAYRLFSNTRLIYAENDEGESNPTLHNLRVLLSPQIDAVKPEEWVISDDVGLELLGDGALEQHHGNIVFKDRKAR